MMQATCKDCPKRHYACHDDCEEYSRFRKNLNNYNAKVHEDARLECWPTHSNSRRRLTGLARKK